MKRFIVSFLILLVVCGTPAFSFDPDELNTITFHNETGYDISYIFLSPGDSEYWGPEILGAYRILEADESLGFENLTESAPDFEFVTLEVTNETVPVSETTDTYNVFAVDEDMDEYYFDVHLNTRYADEDGTIPVSITLDDLAM